MRTGKSTKHMESISFILATDTRDVLVISRRIIISSHGPLIRPGSNCKSIPFRSSSRMN